MFTFIFFAVMVLGILISILLYAIDVIEQDVMFWFIFCSMWWIISIPVTIIVYSFYGFYLLCIKYKHKIRKILRIKDKNNI